MQKEGNLFICYTYLHCLLSLAIIKKKQIKAEVIFISAKKNEINNETIQALLASGVNIRFVKKRMGLSYIKTFEWIFKKKPTNIYVGNLKTGFTRLLFLVLSNFKLYTFDDGIGNIIHSDKSYLNRDSEKMWSYIIFSIFSKRLLYRNIRKDINVHYTIFTQENIYPNTSYIELFEMDKQHISIQHHDKAVNILLGSSFSEYGMLDKKTEIKIINEAVEKLKIDLLIPHPKSTINKKDIKCPLKSGSSIAEFEILKLIEETNKTVNLFAFGSTTLMILENHPNVNCFNIVCAEIVDTNFDVFKNSNIKSVKLNGGLK